MVRPWEESHGPSPLQGHGSWLVCEVALSTIKHGILLCTLLSPYNWFDLKASYIGG